jgi:hypothetical protein
MFKYLQIYTDTVSKVFNNVSEYWKGVGQNIQNCYSPDNEIKENLRDCTVGFMSDTIQNNARFVQNQAQAFSEAAAAVKSECCPKHGMQNNSNAKK